jgi:cytoskeletal protein CcmA (bactofilin family)
MAFWAPLALTAVTGALVALPLTPALRELRKQRDAKPLPTRVDDGKVDNFADSLREYMAPLVALEDSTHNTILHKRLRDGAPGFIVTREAAYTLSEDPIDASVYAPEGLRLPFAVCFTRELYVRGDLELAQGSVIRSALVEGDATLDHRTSVARWIHATETLYARTACRLFGRASAGTSITIAGATKFQRLHAPSIYIGAQDVLSMRTSPGIDDLHAARPGRVRAEGDFQLRDSDVFHGNIISTGTVSIAGNALVVGSIKARASVEVGVGSTVQGAVISEGRAVIGNHCLLKGPVLSEREIVIGTGVQIGSLDHPTTISAPRIRIAPGAIVCGTMWAREMGEVGT